MKVLLASDLHMNLGQLSWLERQASRFDLVAIAGDLLQIAHTCEKDQQIAQVLPLLKRIRDQCPLLLASGNHDGNATNAAGEEFAAWIRDLHARQITTDGQHIDLKHARVTVCPWWNGPETRQTMIAKIQLSQPSKNVPWIWIHHAPPRGSRVAWTAKGDAGDPYLLKLLGKYQPSLVLCGHIHNAPFNAQGAWAEKINRTWVFNAGMQPGQFPAHIEIDLAAQTACHISIEGQENLSLRP